MKYIYIFLLLVGVFLVPLAQAQNPKPISDREAGEPFIRNFSPKDYDAYSQNWAIVQGPDGLMYFGNGSGVLEYDGVSWRLIPVSNKTVVRSLAVDETGRIYVGARGEFGYLAPDEKGQLCYVSLLNRINPENRDFTDVWEILVNSQGVYFRTENHLLLLKRGSLLDEMSATKSAERDTLKYWQANDRPFFFAHKAGDAIFITMKRKGGLVKVVGDTLAEVAVSSQLRQEWAYAFLPLPQIGSDSVKHLVVTSYGTAYIYDGSTFEPFAIDPVLTQFLRDNFFFRAAVLKDGTFALSTISGGIVIMNQQGQWLHTISKTSGLLDDHVYFVYPDREGGLWLALNNGLARVELPAPLSIYDHSRGIKSNVERYGTT